MTKFLKGFVVVLLLTFITVWSSASFAQQTRTVIEPRAENFIFLIDNSGSMGFDYRDKGMKKSELARDVVLALNSEVPELDANFGVYSFAPYKEFRSVSGFNRQAIAGAVQSVPTEFDVFGRTTPMGQDLMKLDNYVSGLSNRVAVIVVTDGESNVGVEPKAVMRDMYSKYGNRLCFHFVSLAQKPSAGTVTSDEQAFIDQLAGLNACTVTADAGELVAKDFVRADFIQRVFYETREIVIAPEPKPEPKPEPVEEVIVFSNVTFDFDSAVIKPEYREILREAAEILKARPGQKVVVEGHTCNIGPADYNMGLSQRRSQAVADFLVEQGVDRNRLETKGYGLTRPQFDNNTREGRSLNRRVEMKLQ
ncbi:OmpA family protein [Desulfonatronovibrio magnus]|uniref:OmpA family protein n=1 Tax=Desulfonatronovibrio magnus TaxID=698827 RepID=UPI0005EAE295|nr:OmpA family protein [Desulfonatronovibrio magnus]